MSEYLMNEIKRRFKESFPEYSFLWRFELESHGDIDVDALLLEVFGVPAKKKLEFVRTARAIRRESESRIGRKIILIAHTPEATHEHYSHLFKHDVEVDGIFIHSAISLHASMLERDWLKEVCFTSIGQAVSVSEAISSPSMNAIIASTVYIWDNVANELVPIDITKVEAQGEDGDKFAKAA